MVELVREEVLNGKKVTFYVNSGEVLDTNKYSETHVSSSGGGGYVGRYGGHVDAPRVSSDVYVNQDVWIKEEDGSEIPVQFSDFNAPIRATNKIAIINAECNNMVLPLRVINFSQRSRCYDAADGREMLEEFNLHKMTGLSFLVLFLIIPALVLVGSSFFGFGTAFFWGVIMGIFYLVVRIATRWEKGSFLIRNIDEIVDDITRKVVQKST